MHPWLWQNPPVSTYGVCLAVGFVLAWVWARGRAKRAGVEPSRVDLLMPVVLGAGIAGAWLGGVVTDALTAAPAQSSVLLGGLLAGTGAGIGYALAIRMPLGILGDIVAPPIALGVAAGRVGCLMAGCCYGKVCPEDAGWMAVRFPAGSFAAVGQGRLAQSLAVYPVQVYESVLCLILALGLARWRAGNDRGITGQKFLAMAIGYAGLRFGLEFLRADNPPIGPLTFSQWTALAVAGLAVGTWHVRRKNADGWRLAYPSPGDSPAAWAAVPLAASMLESKP